MLIFGSLTGHVFQYLVPNQLISSDKIVLIGTSIALIATNLFARDFLRVKQFSNFLHLVFNSLSILGLITLVLLYSISYFYLNIINTIGAFISLILIISTSYWNWYKNKNKYARLFSLAWTVYVFGVIIMIFRNAGILPNNFITSHGVEIGLILQAILLSLALGDKAQKRKYKHK